MTLKTLILGIGLILPAGLAAQTNLSAPAQSPWTFNSSFSARETYDDNVFIQDYGSLAGQDSWVTTLQLNAGLTYQKSPAFKAVLSYAPEVVTFHTADSENHVAHRGTVNFNGKTGNTTWEFLNGLTYIDGSSLGPRFLPPGDIPAIGGIPLRDRRDAGILRNGIKVTQSLGDFFVRPVVNSYYHDFQTEQHRTTEPGFAGYENYIDRYDVGGGLDGGYKIGSNTWVVLGYRYGHQQQMENQNDLPSPYANNYQRVLAGIEGMPAQWLKLNVLAGPDFRDFYRTTPAQFDADELLVFIDASISVMPSKMDTLTLAVRRFEQPAFSSHSVYEDMLYDLTYRRKLSNQFTVAAGGRAYEGDWQAPVNREDWIYTVSLGLIYTHNAHLSGEFAYSYDWVDSKVPNTEGREYTRNLFTLGVKYTF